MAKTKSSELALVIGSRLRLRTRLEHHIERRLRGAAELRKSTTGDHFAEPLFTGLRAKRQSHLLREGGRRAQKRGSSVKRPADGIEIVFEFIAGEGLDDHPRAILLESAVDMSGRTGGIAHVVQAIEESHEVII